MPTSTLDAAPLHVCDAVKGIQFDPSLGPHPLGGVDTVRPPAFEMKMEDSKTRGKLPLPNSVLKGLGGPANDLSAF